MGFWNGGKPEKSSDWSMYPSIFVATVFEGKQSAGLYNLAHFEHWNRLAKEADRRTREKASALGNL